MVKYYLPKCGLLLLLCLSCVLAGCQSTKPAPVTHMVFCWLKESNAANRAKLIEASYALKSIPGIVELSAGPTILSERPIVDDSFDVGIVMTFHSVEAMNAYLVHPEHKAAVKNVLGPLVKKIVVYDIQAVQD